MKFTLGKRLFLAVLAAFFVVGATGVALVRWDVSRKPAPQAFADTEAVARLGDELVARYRERGDWAFIPTAPAQRTAWLGDALASLQAATSRPALSPSLGVRIGLLDAGGRPIAGRVAHPMLVALASIDTLARPLAVDGRPIGTLVVARAENPDGDLAIAFLVDQQNHLALLAAIGVALAVAAAAVLAANFRRPIRQLVEGARRLGAGRFETRLTMRRSDELGELAATFDQLAARLEETEQSRRQWVADTSHELRTPLAVLRAQLEALHDGMRAPTPDNFALALRQVLSLGKLVDDLAALARADVSELQDASEPVDAWQAVLEATRAFSERFARAGLRLVAGPSPERAVVRGDADRLRQVVVNLLENCLRYTDRGGRVEVGAALEGPRLRIVIDDTAPGVPAGALARLGERFYRVDASRSRELGGSGLGLALSRRIVESHGGRLDFEASPLGGLRAIVSLDLVG
jgi:two-component system, OmpR family, sensor histidine kinase BaeS